MLLTLKAFRVNGSTILLDNKGKLKGIYPTEQSQPHKNKKTIISNCFTYKLEWLEDLTIYDNGGESYDRVTIIFDSQKNGGVYNSLASSETGAGFFMHCDSVKGNHLGKKITFKELHEELQNRLINYLLN